MRRCPNCQYDPHELTAREMQVAIFAAQAKSVKETATEFNIGISTVNQFRQNIYKKLGFSGNGCQQAQLVLHALRVGWIKL